VATPGAESAAVYDCPITSCAVATNPTQVSGVTGVFRASGQKKSSILVI